MFQAVKHCLVATSVSNKTETAEHCLRLCRICMSVIRAHRKTERCSAVRLKQSIMEGRVANDSIERELSIVSIQYMKYAISILLFYLG